MPCRQPSIASLICLYLQQNQGNVVPSTPVKGQADQSIRPPGWTGGVVNQARAHLLAATLGGSGSEPRNLVTMDQGANLRMFHEFEGEAAEIAATNPTHCYAYTVTPEYLGTPGKAEDRSLMMPHRVIGNLVDLCTGEVEINQRHVDNLLPH